MRHLTLLIVFVIVMLAPVQATAQTPDEPCLTWNISGVDYEAIADELADGAREVPYVTRLTMDYTRMIIPATDWQIVLIAYCTPGVSFNAAYRDVMRAVIRLYPERWQHYAAVVG